MELGLLVAGAFFAGLVDAVVGGGGLIQIPLLFGVYPLGSPASIFGTNKLSSVFGTFSAAIRYTRLVDIPWAAALPASVAAFICSYLGAMSVSAIPAELLKPFVVVLLVGVATYTFIHKGFGRRDRRVAIGRGHMFGALGLGGLIGFYDGFFGPGTGSLLIFLFIRFFGMDFLRASATAKIVNVMTNVAAIGYFGQSGDVYWSVGIAMAAFNIAGALAGAQLALRFGTGFVRRLFLLVVSVLILRLSWDLIR